MKVLVTGGSGFLGSYIVDSLIKRGFSVSVLLRKQNIMPRLYKAKPIFGDLMSLSIGDVKGHDIVIHSAAIKPDFTSINELRNVNEECTRHLLLTCQRAGIKKFLYISSMAVGAERRDVYAESKEIAEKYVMNSSLEWSVIRIGAIYGLSHWWISQLCLLKRKRFIFVIGDGNQLLYQIYVKDCAEAITSACSDKTIYHQICCLSSDPITYNQSLLILKSLLKATYTKVHIPLCIARILAFVMHHIFRSPKPHYFKDPYKDLSLGGASRLTVYARPFEHGLADMLSESVSNKQIQHDIKS